MSESVYPLIVRRDYKKNHDRVFYLMRCSLNEQQVAAYYHPTPP